MPAKLFVFYQQQNLVLRLGASKMHTVGSAFVDSVVIDSLVIVALIMCEGL